MGLFRRKTKGYSVSPTGRAGLLYTEGTRKIHVDSEMLAGNDFDMVVYLSNATAWAPPHDGDLVTSEDRERIRKNISEAFSSLRVEWR